MPDFDEGPHVDILLGTDKHLSLDTLFAAPAPVVLPEGHVLQDVSGSHEDAIRKAAITFAVAIADSTPVSEAQDLVLEDLGELVQNAFGLIVRSMPADHHIGTKGPNFS